MKTRLLLIVTLLAMFLSACQTKADFSGTWITNVALVTFKQDGDKVTGTVEGYGGYWNFDLSGTVKDSTLTFDGDTPLGKLAIVLANNGKSFKSADATIAFCGSRQTKLPDGCGFTGTWKLNADIAPAGSVAKLQQSGSDITGAVYTSDGKKVTALNASVEWGKGWQAVGTNDWGDFVLSMTADEKAFQLSAGGQFGNEWCGLRKGESSAYVMFFTCTVP